MSYVYCNGCCDERSDICIAYEAEFEAYCDDCWPRFRESVLRQRDYHHRIGHTGSDLCGCELCAARWDRANRAADKAATP